MDKKTYAVVEKYSIPFVQLVMEKEQQKQVLEELSQIKEICEQTHLADFLSHVGLEKTEKEKTLRLFQQSDSELLRHLLEILIQNNREDLFYPISVDCLNKLEKITNEFQVTIKSAAALSEQQKSKLLPIIEKKFALKVRSVKEEVDSSLMGGFVIAANNKTIDASIKHQLQTVKENLK